MSFCKFQIVNIFKRSLLIKENQVSQVQQFSTFSIYGKMQKAGLTKTIPLLGTTAIWGQYPVLFSSCISQGTPLGEAAASDC